MTQILATQKTLKLQFGLADTENAYFSPFSAK
jgi:hypothetical protein